MTYTNLDYGLRAAAFAMTLQAMLVFLRLPRSTASTFGSTFLAAAALQALGMPLLLGLPFPLDALGVAVQAATVPLFWLFARAWFDDAFSPEWPHWCIVAGFAAADVASNLTHIAPEMSHMIDAVTTLAGSGLAVHALWLTWAGRDQDLVEHRRQLRAVFVVVVGMLIVWWLWTNALGPQQRLASPLTLANDALLACVTLLLSVMLFGLHHPDIFAPPAGEAHDAKVDLLVLETRMRSEELPSGVAQNLATLMSDERLYRDPELTIGALSARLGVQEYRLRRYINGALGHRNFNEYLNAHRLAEVCAALGDPAQNEVPILTIALDAGFGSLPAFNRAFKITHNQTPTEYRAKQAIAR